MGHPSDISREETARDAIVVARSVVELIGAERFAEVEELFAPPLRAAVSAGTLRIAWQSEIGKRGAVSSFGQPVSEPIKAGLTRVTIPISCERGALAIFMAVDDAGRLQGLRIGPATTTSWAPPTYANSRRFDEREITLESGSLAVPGTLSLPRGRGRWPGVVLLCGGGPFDRDETAGPNKPLKDLAWGLASRGIAVARFDKVTFAHGDRMASSTTFTMTDEYVPHAVAAIHLLQRQPNIDPTRIFVLGHSMGGKVAPRVAEAEPSVAGLVVLAGDTQPMQRAAMRVARYLAALAPTPETEAAVATLTRQAELVERADLSPSTLASELPFGYFGAYWLDLRSYDPVAAARALQKPMLILQGRRDYQVTVEDDLSGWQAGLNDRPDITMRVYDADNHLFFPGTGPSMPAEYDTAQHVDPAVIADIAKWIAPDQGFIAQFFARSKRTKR